MLFNERIPYLLGIGLSFSLAFGLNHCGGNAEDTQTNSDDPQTGESANAEIEEMDPGIFIQNDSDFELFSLQIRPSGSEEWSDDLIQGSSIGLNAIFQITSAKCGSYDLRFTNVNGFECEISIQDSCAAEGGFILTNDEVSTCDFPTE